MNSSELEPAISGYLEEVRRILSARRGVTPANHASKLKILPSASRVWFEECETSESWKSLVEMCARKLGGGSDGWEWPLRHWFRRTGVYLELLDGSVPMPAVLAERLVRDKSVKMAPVTTVAVLDGVHFAKDRIDFGDFAIIRPTRDEAEELFKFKINRLFYGWLPMIVDRLAEHWFIVPKEESRAQRDGFDADWYSKPRFAPAFSSFSPQIEGALKVLLLWDWGPRDREHFDDQDPWFPFNIPFEITISSDPFEPAPPSPPIGKLLYEPDLNSATGEESQSERPQIWLHFDEAETLAFEDSVRKCQGQLARIRGHQENWEFVDHALGFLVKAWGADGLDQLLWHLVVLEALLGSGKGNSSLIKSKLKALYSSEICRNRQAGKAFDKAYNLRKDFVHGNKTVTREIEYRSLRNARALARQACVRMIGPLSELAIRADPKEMSNIPTRDDILEVLVPTRDPLKSSDLRQAVRQVLDGIPD